MKLMIQKIVNKGDRPICDAGIYFPESLFVQLIRVYIFNLAAINCVNCLISHIFNSETEYFLQLSCRKQLGFDCYRNHLDQNLRYLLRAKL